jgi:hypothetical protein
MRHRAKLSSPFAHVLVMTAVAVALALEALNGRRIAGIQIAIRPMPHTAAPWQQHYNTQESFVRRTFAQN